MLSFEDATALHNHDIGSLLGDAGPMGVPGWSKNFFKTRLWTGHATKSDEFSEKFQREAGDHF